MLKTAKVVGVVKVVAVSSVLKSMQKSKLVSDYRSLVVSNSRSTGWLANAVSEPKRSM